MEMQTGLVIEVKDNYERIFYTIQFGDPKSDALCTKSGGNLYRR